jgi:hypothetical protein
MIWELLDTGHLRHWWEYVLMVLCVLIAAGGPAAIWIIWTTRPRKGSEWQFVRGSLISGLRSAARRAMTRRSTGPR